MKTKYAIAAALMLSISGFAQKDELKALKKLDEKEQPTPADFQEYKRLLVAVAPKMDAATPEQKAEYYYYKGTFGMVELMMKPSESGLDTVLSDLNQVIEIEKAGKKKYTKEIQGEVLPEIKTAILTMAAGQNSQNNYKMASAYYAAAFKVDPTDYGVLYNAAAMALNAKEYDKALEHYLILDKAGFTGEGMAYAAKNKEKNIVEYFPNKSTRDIGVKSGQYIEPKDEVLSSKKGDIVKNIALIYSHKGDFEKAKAAMTNARKSNPNDVSLLTAEADLYLQTNDLEMYKKLVSDIIQKNPNNADLFYNLGVITTATNKAEAMKHYEKALQIKPDYVNANINMGVLILDEEKVIVEEMNNPKTTDKRYEELKAKRNALYRKSLPYFDAAHKADPANTSIMEIMVGVYQALEMDKETKAMKAKMK